MRNLHAHCKAITRRSSCANLASKLRQPCLRHFPLARVAIESVQRLLPADGWMQEFDLTRMRGRVKEPHALRNFRAFGCVATTCAIRLALSETRGDDFSLRHLQAIVR